MLFNPTDQTLSAQEISLPLYYTGLRDTAQVSVDGGAVRAVALNRDYTIDLEVDMPPRSIHTVVISSDEFYE